LLPFPTGWVLTFATTLFMNLAQGLKEDFLLPNLFLIKSPIGQPIFVFEVKRLFPIFRQTTKRKRYVHNLHKTSSFRRVI